VVPRGGLPALTVAVNEVKRGPTPSLLVNPGNWLSSASQGEALAPSTLAVDQALHEALFELRFDALNVGYRDLPAVGLAPHPGMVSVTQRPAVLPVAKYKRFDVGGLDVLVTGASPDRLSYLQPAGTVVEPAVPALRELLGTVDADLVVVLAYDESGADLAEVPGVDVVIEAGEWAQRSEPRVVGDAVWVKSVAQGRSLGELYLWVEDGRVTKAVDRQVELIPKP
jgi:hypothetical protein